jgi:hypothetical protein
MFTPVVLAADYAETIQLTDRTDVRLRATQTTGQQTTPGAPPAPTQPIGSGLDFDNQAAVLFNANNRTWRFSLVYSPVVTLENVQQGISAQNEPLLLQTATGFAAWHSRRTRLTLSESLSYGHYNSAYLFQAGAPSATSSPGQVAPPPTMSGAPPPATSVQLAPKPTDVYYGSTTTSLALSETLDRRTTASIDGGYGVSGGLDEVSRSVSPLAYGPHADASVGYVLSRSLRTVTLASAQLTNFTATQCYTSNGTFVPGTGCHPEDQLALVTQGLRDSLGRTWLLSIDAGAALTRLRTDSGVPFVTRVYPEGDASISHRFGPRGLETLIVSASLGAQSDQRTGLITYGASGSVTLIDMLSSVVTVSVDAVGGQTLPTDDPLAASIIRSDLEARFRMDRYGRVILIAGESELWQDQGTLGAFLSIYGYFGVTVATPALPF